MIFGIDADFDTSDIADCLSHATATWGGETNPISFVMRYLRLPASGGMTPQEAFALSSSGLKIVSISEHQSTTQAYFTRDRGTDDAKTAYAHAVEVIGAPIYFAVDYDAWTQADFAAVTDYFGGVNDWLRGQDRSYPVGIYAGSCVLDVVQNANLATYFWQISISAGFCGGANASPWPGAHVRQVVENFHVCDRDVDLDVAAGDGYGGWILPVLAGG